MLSGTENASASRPLRAAPSARSNISSWKTVSTRRDLHPRAAQATNHNAARTFARRALESTGVQASPLRKLRKLSRSLALCSLALPDGLDQNLFSSNLLSGDSVSSSGRRPTKSLLYCAQAVHNPFFKNSKRKARDDVPSADDIDWESERARLQQALDDYRLKKDSPVVKKKMKNDTRTSDDSLPRNPRRHL